MQTLNEAWTTVRSEIDKPHRPRDDRMNETSGFPPSAPPKTSAEADTSAASHRRDDSEDVPSASDTAEDCLDWFFGALTETMRRHGVHLTADDLALLVSDAPKALARRSARLIAMRPRLTMVLMQAIEADKALGGRLLNVASGMAVPISWELRYRILSRSSDESVLLYALDELFTGESMGVLLPP